MSGLIERLDNAGPNDDNLFELCMESFGEIERLTERGRKLEDRWGRADAKRLDLQARVAALEGWVKVSSGLKCPSCDNVGWLAVQTDYDEWEQQQCEFCYTVPDSVFNRKAATEQEGET